MTQHCTFDSLLQLSSVPSLMCLSLAFLLVFFHTHSFIARTTSGIFLILLFSKHSVWLASIFWRCAHPSSARTYLHAHTHTPPCSFTPLHSGVNVHAVDKDGQNALLIFVKSPVAFRNLKLLELLLLLKIDSHKEPTSGPIWSAGAWVTKMMVRLRLCFWVSIL